MSRLIEGRMCGRCQTGWVRNGACTFCKAEVCEACAGEGKRGGCQVCGAAPAYEQRHEPPTALLAASGRLRGQEGVTQKLRGRAWFVRQLLRDEAITIDQARRLMQTALTEEEIRWVSRRKAQASLLRSSTETA